MRKSPIPLTMDEQHGTRTTRCDEDVIQFWEIGIKINIWGCKDCLGPIIRMLSAELGNRFYSTNLYNTRLLLFPEIKNS
jgi:hypothetical protein